MAFSWLLQGGFDAAIGDIVRDSLRPRAADTKSLMSFVVMLLTIEQIGILAGHTYVFLQDYWPREMWSTTGQGEIKTPRIVYVPNSLCLGYLPPPLADIEYRKRLFGEDTPEQDRDR